MRFAILFLFLPLTAFAQVSEQGGNFSLNVSIAKKSPAGEIEVRATDQGSARHPIKLSVRVKCANQNSWFDLRKQFPEIPKSVCYMFEEKRGDWQEGQQTLTIQWAIRDESKSRPATDVDAAAASAPCSRGQKAVIDLREVCATQP